MRLARRALVAALVMFPGLASASPPLGYHLRTTPGWVLVAVQASIPDYTACLLKTALVAPERVGPGSDAGELPDPARPPVLARELAGRLVIRADAESPLAAVRALLRAPANPTGATDEGLDEVDRHLLALCGVSRPRLLAEDGDIRTRPPVLLVAGPGEPAALMQQLLDLVSRHAPLPPGERLAVASTGDALAGWWRHLERGDPAGSLALGFALPDVELAADAARRVAFRALTMRFNQSIGGAVWREVPTGRGRIWWVRVAGKPDELPAVRGALQAVLQELREKPLPPAEIVAHREYLRQLDKDSVAEPDRWFAETLLRAESGQPPRSAYDMTAIWDSVDADAVQQTCLSAIPREVTAVSSGTIAERMLPTERWSAGELLPANLRSETGVALAKGALDRMCGRLAGAARVEAIEVESDWSGSLSGTLISGRLVEVLRFPDAIHQEFRPAGSDVPVRRWLAEGGAFATLAGEPRDLSAEDRRRLRDRLRSDPWCLCALAGAGDTAAVRAAYLGGIREQGEVYQRVRVGDGAGFVVVDLDPESALPRRVALATEEAPGMTVEYGYGDFQAFEGLMYPGRIECRLGLRRESVSIIRAVTARSRLAAAERLQ